MQKLEWVRKGNGRADSVCGKYQLSITKTKGQNRYICFYVKGERSEPFENIGQRFSPDEAKRLCEAHAMALGA